MHLKSQIFCVEIASCSSVLSSVIRARTNVREFTMFWQYYWKQYLVWSLLKLGKVAELFFRSLLQFLMTEIYSKCIKSSIVGDQDRSPTRIYLIFDRVNVWEDTHNCIIVYALSHNCIKAKYGYEEPDNNRQTTTA